MTACEEILSKAENEAPSADEARLLLQRALTDKTVRDTLFETASKVRKETLGDRFYWTAGIASVLPCRLKPLCFYCPYWREKEKEPLSMAEILKGVEAIHDRGIREFHLSGGTSMEDGGEDMLAIVRGIHEAGFSDMRIIVNCGAVMDLSLLKKLRQLGVAEVGSIFEITDPAVFRRLKPGDSLERKKAFAERIAEAGLAVETGIMAGLGPAETRIDDYVRSIFDVRKVKSLRSVYVSKFMPMQGTPMAGHPVCSAEEASCLIAVMRLVLREIQISPAAGWKIGEREWAYRAGGGVSVLGVHINRKPGREQKTDFTEKAVEVDDRREEMKQVLSKIGASALCRI